MLVYQRAKERCFFTLHATWSLLLHVQIKNSPYRKHLEKYGKTSLWPDWNPGSYRELSKIALFILIAGWWMIEIYPDDILFNIHYKIYKWM